MTGIEPVDVGFRTGTAADTEECLALWIEACATRDGVAVIGVADRARPKFGRAQTWIVADSPDEGILGFVVATMPGSGLPGDPPEAPVIGLIAVAPRAQGRRLGGALMAAVADDLARHGHTRAVLHVLMDNEPAVRLYTGTGWLPLGEPFEHSLLNRPTQAYVLELAPHVSQRLEVVHATESDRATLEQLWTMFRHDMSAFTAVLPDSRGRFRQERLDSALSDPAWGVHLLRLGTNPVGLGIVRGLDTDERVINSFFLVHGARRAGHGRTAVRAITRGHPGAWAVAFQEANVGAARFWRSVARDTDRQWTETRRDVPGRPDLPADSWVRFRVLEPGSERNRRD